MSNSTQVAATTLLDDVERARVIVARMRELHDRLETMEGFLAGATSSTPNKDPLADDEENRTGALYQLNDCHEKTLNLYSQISDQLSVISQRLGYEG